MYRLCYTYIMPEIKLQTDDLISFSEAARLLKVTRVTIYAMIRRGQLTPLAIADRRYLLKNEVNQLQSERATTGPAVAPSTEEVNNYEQ